MLEKDEQVSLLDCLRRITGHPSGNHLAMYKEMLEKDEQASNDPLLDDLSQKLLNKRTPSSLIKTSSLKVPVKKGSLLGC